VKCKRCGKGTHVYYSEDKEKTLFDITKCSNCGSTDLKIYLSASTIVLLEYYLVPINGQWVFYGDAGFRRIPYTPPEWTAPFLPYPLPPPPPQPELVVVRYRNQLMKLPPNEVLLFYPTGVRYATKNSKVPLEEVKIIQTIPKFVAEKEYNSYWDYEQYLLIFPDGEVIEHGVSIEEVF